jgi:transketolase
VDGHDSDAIDRAIREAKAAITRPSLICCKTVIAKGAPNKAGTHDAHGAPLGEQEIAAARAAIEWDYAPFEIPAHVYEQWDARSTGVVLQLSWDRTMAEYARLYPQEAAELRRRMRGELPPGFTARLRELTARTRAKASSIATRKASQEVIEGLAPVLPELIGGSADLTGSNLTAWSGSRPLSAPLIGSRGGNYLHYGVREFGMAAIMNGLALHGGFIPYGGSFLAFSDYCRNALRLAALMRVRSLFVFTHDSIGLGEDGPTHQPVEQLSSLRLIPNMDVWRPCDTVESIVAWAAAIERADGPTCLIFSRQNLPFQTRSAGAEEDIRRGGYVLLEPREQPRAILIATGSEVALAVEAQRALTERNVPVRVVSMPSTTVFDRQPASFRQCVLPVRLPCVAIEAGASDLWRKYVGRSGAVVGLDRFGESAPAGELFRHFGFTPERVVDVVMQVLSHD